uniref:hypothetical protein n=1 Tax=Thaumasiovibrio occultus TaxID=1891184 RepID=UPI000B362F4B
SVIGKDGYFFLNESNNPIGNYYRGSLNESMVSGWCDVISKRKLALEKFGCKFLQIIFPEKQSIIGDKLLVGVDEETTNLKKINENFKNDNCYLNITEIFKKLYSSDIIPYRKLDTHLSYQGARFAVEEILKCLELSNIKIDRPLLISEMMSGDLGNKFAHGAFWENQLVPDPGSWELGMNTPMLVKEINPENGHIGIVRHWKNKQALINKRIMIFGNSFFERGISSLGLSYWFSRLFKEVYFIWSPTFDIDLVCSFSPDYVICQTVERFLPAIPKDNIK